ncbi:MAG: class I SAM-dependent methyltransferase [Planctomycetota bacterium]
MPSPWHLSPDAQRRRYEKHRNTLEDIGYTDMLARPISLIREYAPDARRVLDYGSGPAEILVEMLKQADYDAAGYDPIFASVTNLSLPFDAVTCIETFEHFAAPHREIRRIAALIRPGGLLVVQTLFHPGPDRLGDWWYVRDPTHVAFYSHSTLDWICQAFGLTSLYRDDKNLAVFRQNKHAPSISSRETKIFT